MGYEFEVRGRSVWSPSIGTATAFLSELRSLERQLECESGITGPVSDTVAIDPTPLRMFLRALGSAFGKHLTGGLPEGAVIELLALSLRTPGAIDRELALIFSKEALLRAFTIATKSMPSTEEAVVVDPAEFFDGRMKPGRLTGR